MPFTYVNRRGQTYYLHIGKTKTGKPKYNFSRSSEGVLADELPVEYEIREQVTGQISVRLAKPKLITDEEERELENAVAEVVPENRFYVDRNEKLLTVYVVDLEGDSADVLRRIGGPLLSDARIDEFITQSGRYEHTFRFQLFDAKWRVFQTQRYCYRGSVDAWIDIGGPGFLPDLAETYLKHIGQMSFYDLMGPAITRRGGSAGS